MQLSISIFNGKGWWLNFYNFQNEQAGEKLLWIHAHTFRALFEESYPKCIIRTRCLHTFSYELAFHVTMYGCQMCIFLAKYKLSGWPFYIQGVLEFLKKNTISVMVFFWMANEKCFWFSIWAIQTSNKMIKALIKPKNTPPPPPSGYPMVWP